MNAYEQTKRTYERSAEALTHYYVQSGTRQRHMDTVLALVQPQPTILELGCGNGRDAAYLTPRSSDYVGIDYSEPLLAIARENVPDSRFVTGDMVTTPYPANRNIVFAFASLLHLSPSDVATVMRKVHDCLQPTGIFYISTKFGDGTMEKKDRFGERTYYLYQPAGLERMAGPYFEVVSVHTEHSHDSEWVELTLRRR